MSKTQKNHTQTQNKKRPETLDDQRSESSYLHTLWHSDKSKLFILLICTIVLVSFAFYLEIPIGFSMYTPKKTFSLSIFVYLIILAIGLSGGLYLIAIRYYKSNKKMSGAK